MASRRKLNPAWVTFAPLFLAFMTATLVRTATAQSTSKRQVIAYIFPNLPDDRPLTEADLKNISQLTRVNYSFALIKGGKVVEGDPQDAANLALLQELRRKHPPLELVVSIGGWLGSGGFSDAALTQASRRTFVESAMVFLRRYQLDGLDLDWEFPGLTGAGNRFRPQDGSNFTLLLRDLRARFDAESRQTHRPLRLTIAAGSTYPYLRHTQMGQSQRYLDSVNLMTYDFYEPSEGKPTRTGNHAPLFADPADPQQASSAAMVQAFEQAGVPADKIILGVPFYGHAWTGVPATNNGLFQMGTAVPPSFHTSYADIQELLHSGFTRYWDAPSQVPYAYNRATGQWISYEDPESLKHKCAYIEREHLGGIMFWQLLADRTGTLLNTIDASLSSGTTQQANEAQP